MRRLSLRGRLPLLVVFVSLLAALPIAPAGGQVPEFPEFSSPYTQDSDGDCQHNAIDPINILFRGKFAGVPTTADQIVLHAGWFPPNDSGSNQDLNVHAGGGTYYCRQLNDQRASNCGLCDRFHTRLWIIPNTRGTDHKKTVGDAHHEDFVPWSPVNPGCNFPFGSHAVDADGSQGSGFDQGRRHLWFAFADAGHHVTNDVWGNTRNFEQCDRDTASSNGTGTLIGINHRH